MDKERAKEKKERKRRPETTPLSLPIQYPSSNTRGTGTTASSLMAPGPISQPPDPGPNEEEEGEEEEKEGGGGSPWSSRYSSCGESEFDRYCSAASAMGTSSLSGSLDPTEGLDGNPGNFDLCGRGFGNFGGGEVALRLSDLERRLGSGSSGSAVGKESGGEGSFGVSEKGEGFGVLDMDGNEEEEDGDSMYGWDSCDESGGDRLYVHTRRVERGEWKPSGDWNPLVMGSSVAFGSDDWDDFEQGSGGGGGLAPLGLDVFEYRTGGGPPGGSKADLFAAPDVGEGDELEADGSEEVRDIPVASCQVQGCEDSAKNIDGSSISLYDLDGVCELEQDDVIDIFKTGKLDHGSGYAAENSEAMPFGGILEMEQDPLPAKVTFELGMSIKSRDSDKETPYVEYEDPICSNKGNSVGNQGNCELEVQVDHLSGITKLLVSQLSEGSVVENVLTTLPNKSSVAEDLRQNDSEMAKADGPVNGFYDEIVNEMEHILLDSGESPGTRFPQGIHTFPSHQSLPLRDGGSTASTSGTEDAFSLISRPLRIDGVEVIAAKQKKGDVSFSERLVGVKEFTVYVIRVRSGQDQWEVERRYRDFYTLYRRLKSYFADHGWTLPLSWSAIEQESRKIFGSASPDVVSERSALIQECLQSIIHSGLFSSSPSAVAWFLYPPDTFPNSPAVKAQQTLSIFSEKMDNIESISYLGRTISLIVEVQPYNPMKRMLELQHYKCAGCHKHFDDGMTLLRDFVQSLGWGRPRRCEYSGQLFCPSCHTNETAILPARVLHHWDFTQYAVSELAKSYLDSIHDQPMLCVSAVNPFLFSKVPALHHVMTVRKRIGTLLLYVRCPFRMNINQGLGSRRYLLESNDFFALRDLIDLSKGAFAALPVMLETVSSKIIEHITDQCLICCDVGVPCSAQQACNDPSSLIFPFQEDEIEKCKSCGSVYHKLCLSKLSDCSCGAELGAHNAFKIGNKLSRMSSANLFGRKPSSFNLPAGWLTRLFSKTNLQDTEGHKDGDTTILMGSLPTTTL